MSTREDPPIDESKNDEYFGKRELIPGFPFQEFESISGQAEYWNDSEIRIVDGKLFRCISQRTLNLINHLPPEVQEMIFEQIVDQHISELSKSHPPLSTNLALNWTPDFKLRGEVPRNRLINTASVFGKFYRSPVRYSFRTSSPVPKHVNRNNMIVKFFLDPHPSLGASFDLVDPKIVSQVQMELNMIQVTVEAIPTLLRDIERKAYSLSKPIESDYVTFRSYDKLLRAAQSIAHAEGLILRYNNTDNMKLPKWENRKSSSLMNAFLSWFWRGFELNISYKFEVGIQWLQSNLQQFSLLQNISIDLDFTDTIYDIDTDYTLSLLELNDRPYFKEMCDYLKQLPNLKTLNVTIQIERDAVQSIIQSPGAFKWISTLRSLPVSERFRVCYVPESSDMELFPAYFEYTKSPELIRICKLDSEMEGKLQDILIPESLCQGKTCDLPDDLGTAGLFWDGNE